MKKITVLIFITFSLANCTSRQTDYYDKPVLVKYYSYDKVWKTDTLYLDRFVRNDTLSFIYKLNPDTFGYSFFKSIKNDSLINFSGQDCPLVSRQTFRINNKDYTISKYYYNVKNSYDEESNLFYHNDYGLLVFFNLGWFTLGFSMEQDKISKSLIDSIIKDRTGFYMIDIPPPPPLNDSLIIEIE